MLPDPCAAQVMDDNKILTLASNERIPLTPSMRLLLEINHMNHCSPATVSRGGVVFINADDIGWKPVRSVACTCLIMTYTMGSCRVMEVSISHAFVRPIREGDAGSYLH